MRAKKLSRKAKLLAGIAFMSVVLFVSFFSFADAAPVTVNCSGTAGSPTAVDEASLSGDAVTFSDGGGDGYCVLDNSISAASVLINPNVVLTHTAEDADGVTITTTGDFTIDVNASINVDAKGCANAGADHGYGPDGSNVCTQSTAGWGNGATIVNGAKGAGHGGAGGNGSTVTVGGATYGSNTAPVLLGSSGGSITTVALGGSGGGLVRLDVSGNFTHNGSITADGGNGGLFDSNDRAGGGGSGGSIYITVTGAFAGSTGTFSSDGGDGANDDQRDGGGGGGGRISLNYGSSSFVGLGSEDFTATGGTATDSAVAGGDGTVYVKNTTTNAVTIYHGFDYAADYSEASWTVDSSATNQSCDGASDATPSITVTGALTLAGTLNCTHASVTGFDTSAGTSATLSGLTFTMNATDIWTMNDAVPVTLTSSTINSNVQWTNMTTLSIDSSSTINANEKGCTETAGSHGFGPNGSNVCTVSTAGWGNGATINNGAKGGGHGGAGGNGSTITVGGATYGSNTAPVLFGSSGGGVTTVALGGSGGGLIRLQLTGAFTHNGAISADGGDGGVYDSNDRAAGGGSGGSIYVTAGSVIEDGGATGTFSADGGDGADDNNQDGGGGGGGRISIEYGLDTDSLVSNLTAAAVAVGGTATGSAVAGSTGTLSKVLIPVLTSVTINDNNASGFTNDTTPQITLVTGGSTATHIAFSCNAGSNWSDWLTYPDDDVVNDGDGPEFNITSGATGCSATEELKTITAKVKDGSAVESSTTNDTTTYDVSAPSVSSVTATNANDTYGAGILLTVTVQFDESMAVSGTPQLELDFDGTDRQASYASLSTDTLSFTYTTQNGDNVSDLAYTGTGALTLNGGTITDLAGNTATLTLATPGEANSLSANKAIVVSTNQNPTVASVTPVQSTDGSGDVTITFIMDDPDDDDTLQAKIEYSVNGGGAWADPTLSTTDSETTATYGDPDIDNAAATYQVGQSGAYITSSSGANTVSIVWEAATDVAADTDISNAQIRVTPYDSVAAGTAGTSSNFELDVVAPTGLTALSYTGFSVGNMALSWSAATDTNFANYEVWYGASQTDVQNRTGAAVEWDNDDDSDLVTAATTGTDIITDPRNKYYKVFAVDDYGNAGTVTEIFLGGIATGGSAELEVPTGLRVTDYEDGGMILTWTDPDDDDSTHVQVLKGLAPYPVDGAPIALVQIGKESYVDTEVSFGDTVAYQIRATNGSATGSLTDEVNFVVGSVLGGDDDEEEVVEEEVIEVVEDEETIEEEIVEEEEEVEEVVEEEEETLEDLGVDVPTDWRAGYLRWVAEDENVVEEAKKDDDFADFMQRVFDDSEQGTTRGGAVWILAALTGADLSDVNGPTFSDLSTDHNAYEAVEAAYEDELIEGYEDGTFKPDVLLNRAEAFKLLVGYFGEGCEPEKNPFDDVADDVWYAEYVLCAYMQGIVSPEDGKFNPSETMNYLDFVKIVLLAKDAWGGKM